MPNISDLCEPIENKTVKTFPIPFLSKALISFSEAKGFSLEKLQIGLGKLF